MRRLKYPILFIGLSLGLLLAACAGTAPEPVEIRVGLLPILDALPMYVAEEQGYFEARGLSVEFVPVSSAAERDQLMQAGQIDAMINELISTMFYNENETQIVVVRFARLPTPDYPQFRILASEQSGIESVDDLRGVEIGISEGTIIEYTTDRMLEAEGFAPQDIATIAVPRIPDRLALLQSGEIPAANLPDPLASLAIQGGARVILDDTRHLNFSHSVISFEAGFVERNGEGVRAFLEAVEQAVEDINADKERWSDVMTERNLVPAPLIGSYTVPDFPLASVPSQSLFDDSLAWVMEKGLISRELSYADSVDASFLP